MNHFPIHLPTSAVFGAGAAKALGDRNRIPSGDRAVILAADDGRVFTDGSLDRVQGHLSEAGAGAMVMDMVPCPSGEAVAQTAANRALEAGCSFMVALGGAEVIDTAKRAANIAGLAMVAVCTRPPSGSEADQWSLLPRADLPGRAGPGPAGAHPCLLVADPDIMDNGESQAARSGLGALGRAVEAFSSALATPFSDLLALEAVGLAAASLPVLGQDPNAPARLAWAGVLAGMALGLSGPGPASALAATLAASGPGMPVDPVLAALAPGLLLRCPLPGHRAEALAAVLDADNGPARHLENLVRSLRMRYQMDVVLPASTEPAALALSAVEDFNAFFATAPGRPDVAEAEALIMDMALEIDRR